MFALSTLHVRTSLILLDDHVALRTPHVLSLVESSGNLLSAQLIIDLLLCPVPLISNFLLILLARPPMDDLAGEAVIGSADFASVDNPEIPLRNPEAFAVWRETVEHVLHRGLRLVQGELFEVPSELGVVDKRPNLTHFQRLITLKLIHDERALDLRRLTPFDVLLQARLAKHVKTVLENHPFPRRDLIIQADLAGSDSPRFYNREVVNMRQRLVTSHPSLPDKIIYDGGLVSKSCFRFFPTQLQITWLEVELTPGSRCGGNPVQVFCV